MDSKTPLRLKLKLGTSGNSSTSEPVSPATKMVDEVSKILSEDEVDYEDDWLEEVPANEYGIDEEESPFPKQQSVTYEDSSRERHKKSKKKKKKKEKEKERHKHKHHKERNEMEEEESPPKKMNVDISSPETSSKLSQNAFKELLEVLLLHLQKRDAQNFFASPVTDIIAPGYSSIISEPMDFSTIQKKIQDGAYEKLSQFEYDLQLICNNCMNYNQPDTIYYKAAKKLLHVGERLLTPEKITPLRKDLPLLTCLTKEQLGFDINVDIPCSDTEEMSQDSTKVSDVEGADDLSSKYEAIQDEVSPEEVLEEAQRAAEEAAEKLTQKKPVSTLGFLRQRGDGTTTLNFLTGCEGNDPTLKEKPITLGKLTGKLTQGSSTLHNYRDDKRSMAKPVKPLSYGNFSSFCPSYDSTFANLNKEESDMVYATYGNDTAVQYAESICDFSRDCDMAMHLVDQLLNLLTHQQHSKTKAVIDERKRVSQEEQRLQSLLFCGVTDETESRVSQKDFSPNFSALRSLKDIGIDTGFLDSFEKLEQRDKMVGTKLSENATLLEALAQEQKERLSKPLPTNLHNLPQPSESELNLVEKVSESLISVAREVPPGALAPLPIVRRALGITMVPVTSEASEQRTVGQAGVTSS